MLSIYDGLRSIGGAEGASSSLYRNACCTIEAPLDSSIFIDSLDMMWWPVEGSLPIAGPATSPRHNTTLLGFFFGRFSCCWLALLLMVYAYWFHSRGLGNTGDAKERLLYSSSSSDYLFKSSGARARSIASRSQGLAFQHQRQPTHLIIWLGIFIRLWEIY